MNERVSYEKTVSDLDTLKRRLALYDALVAAGIPKRDVQFYDTPRTYSGYSMGETIVVRVNGNPVQAADLTKQYAKSCKYKPTHGYVVLDFTKKDFREYVNLCKERATCKGLFMKGDTIRSLYGKALVASESRLKGGVLV